MTESVIITGATSFIGLETLKILTSQNIHVYAVVRPNSKNLYQLSGIDNLTIIPLEMENYDTLDRLIPTQTNAFFHFAWDGVRGLTRNDIQLQSWNYFIGVKALNAATKLGCKVFVGAGSQAEYGQTLGEISEEGHLEAPLTAYGINKLRLYEFASNYCGLHSMRLIWARIFSVYGRDDYENSLVSSTVKGMIQNNPLNFTKAEQCWDFLHVNDAAKALILLSKTESACGMYHIASGQSKLLKNYILEIAEILNSKSFLTFGAISYPSEGAIGFSPSIEKLNKIGWKAEISFHDGILDLYSKYTTQTGGLKNETN